MCLEILATLSLLLLMLIGHQNSIL